MKNQQALVEAYISKLVDDLGKETAKKFLEALETCGPTRTKRLLKAALEDEDG